ncbi:hypothetical protein ABIB59_004541 [Citrobacter sp. UYEF32]
MIAMIVAARDVVTAMVTGVNKQAISKKERMRSFFFANI